MDHNARREAANRRAVDDGRDMWGLIDWKQEAYEQEDRANIAVDMLRRVLSGTVTCDEIRHAIGRATGGVE